MPRTTVRKIKSYKPAGQYKETSENVRKRTVDFRLLQVSPNVIKWRNGKVETVTSRKLKTLQRKYTWMTDF